MRIKKIFAALLIMAVVFSASFTNAGFRQEAYADTGRGIFSKDEEIVNFGLELMDMDDPIPFEIYSALREINTQTDELRIDFKEPVTLEGNSLDDSLVKNQELVQRVSNSIQIALDAFKLDYPEIFWLVISRTRSSMTIGVKNYSDNRKVYSVKGIKMTIGKSESIGDLDLAYDAVYKKLSACVNSVADLSVYDKLKEFHDFLCENLEYDMNAVNAHDIYGALMDGRSVCEGYSECLKALCDLAGIPCILVVGRTNTGEHHMWNDCLMDDNKWYAMDVTWDDQSEIIYDFFLCGSETVSKRITRNKFVESHFEHGDISYTGLYEFSYPELSKEAYRKDTMEPSGSAKPSESPLPSESIVTPEPSDSPQPSEPVVTSDPSDGPPVVSESPDPGNSTEPAETTDPSSFKVKVADDATAIINGYDGEETDIVIPSEIEGHTVTGIGEGGFKNSSLNSVVIPDTVTSIGSEAFAGSEDLTSITIPASVTGIAEDAFTGCKQLVIKGYADSAAFIYAKEHGIEFELLDEKTDILYGDVDGDGIVDANDALLILKIAAQLETASDVQEVTGDMDKNGSLDANDALIVLKIAAQLI